ncbi:hypothetical protein N6L26_00945 [Qipengyuania sp. SS22]|uniref:hypothetical protein n=1 Tax=Qipengyuania sp. SS22 TaxID=2979461 RepID=UPI0021E56A25|nr:hypothetical protein [Qipengyuania sp. SS22]UYH55168.1 hypothetical protein N6L26_00945 [Qipengyuania sp. SS22]
MPGVGMLLVIVGTIFLTGAVAFYISRNVEHGEARFGPDGEQLPTHPPAPEKKDMSVTLTQSEKIDE